MKLILDIGNTETKAAIFCKKELIGEIRLSKLNFSNIFSFVGDNKITSSILSSVKSNNIQITNKILETYSPIIFTCKTPIPVNSLYTTPETLGLDRIAAVVGASTLFPKKDILVFDLGTCLTIDYIDRNKNYYGGRISPGIKMRYNALHHFTDQLPNLSYKRSEDVLGDNTHSAIHTGVQRGVMNEIMSTISYYRKENPEILVVVTGGDSFFLDSELKNSIFADPFLVLKGLNEILDYNENT
ncbi:MAG: type III pantothenate kinase [Bacteroidota bacterium]|nr:type III pantothenate kinase [Bacteroidota bacterium]